MVLQFKQGNGNGQFRRRNFRGNLNPKFPPKKYCVCVRPICDFFSKLHDLNCSSVSPFGAAVLVYQSVTKIMSNFFSFSRMLTEFGRGNRNSPIPTFVRIYNLAVHQTLSQSTIHHATKMISHISKTITQLWSSMFTTTNNESESTLPRNTEAIGKSTSLSPFDIFS